MDKAAILAAACALLAPFAADAPEKGPKMNVHHLADINFRDPFILPAAEEGRYYLFGTTGAGCWGGPQTGFDAYVSRDLETWEGPIPAFRPPAGFWADRNFWAPEVHPWHGRYYMFASFKAEGVCRGTQILVSDTPAGPFRPHSDGPVTPREWECLDGTLFIDGQGMPWIVFCHEWVQVNDGEICAMPLTPALDRRAGPPLLLFRASSAAWAASVQPGEPKKLVTDGPFVYRAGNGELLMLWSTLGEGGKYLQGVARSKSGRVVGPWEQDPDPLYAGDGGHGMLFRTFGGGLMLALHTPNKTPDERPILLPVVEEDGHLRLAKD